MGTEDASGGQAEATDYGSGPLLEPGVYDEAEISAHERVPNRIVECTRTVTFDLLGYPTRVESIRALWRFANAMQQGRLVATFNDLLKGITEDEFEIARFVTRRVRDLTQRCYGRRLVATGPLVRAIHMLRLFRILYPDRNGLIFEVGPGSGYLGALVVADGYSYACTDIAQSFYLFQNHLLRAVAPEGVVELAIDDRELSDISSVKPGSALHVPWWKFYQARPHTALRVDAMTCNHSLAEMHDNSLGYLVNFSHKLLNPVNGAFVFEGWGSTIHTPIWTVAKRFADSGFVIAHNDVTASVFVQGDGILAKGALKLPRPSSRRPTLGIANDDQQMYSEMYHPPIYSTRENRLSAKLTDGLEAQRDRQTVSLQAFEAMLRDELGDKDLESDDEAFVRFVNSKH